MKKPPNFESFTREELLRRCLEQEDELEKYRPKPAKYKLGQLLSTKELRPNYAGQPCFYFVALSVEHRNGRWLYGYGKSSNTGAFHCIPEEKVKPITQAEFTGQEGTASEATPTIVEPVVETGQAQIPAPGTTITFVGPAYTLGDE